jgi:ubiquinone/menaquinone biosynthesis C-methylase UbiE
MNETVSVSPSPEILNTLDWEGLKYTVVRVALELDIFTTIAEGHHTLENIAAVTHSSKRGMGILLDALCPLGLLNKSGGEYTLTPPSEAFLVRGKPTDCVDVYLAWWRARDRLVEGVRTGTAGLDLSGPDGEEHWASYAAQDLLIWPQSAENDREIWETLGVNKETMPGLHILDVGCGSGIKSFVLAQTDPDAHVTALDFSKVLEISAKVAEAMGVAQQITFCPGNLITADVATEQFDIVLFGAILYYFNPDQVKDVLRKAYQALRTDGLLVIRTLITDEERCQSEEALLVAVELFNVAPYSRVYTFSEYDQLIKEAGFAHVTRHGDMLISARKHQ